MRNDRETILDSEQSTRTRTWSDKQLDLVNNYIIQDGGTTQRTWPRVLLTHARAMCLTNPVSHKVTAAPNEHNKL